jgi:hypothetical protein
LIQEKYFRKVCKKLDFLPKQYFEELLFKISALLSNHELCKIGLGIIIFQLNILLAAPGAPAKVKVVSGGGRTYHVSWLPPAQPNGIIIR